MTNIFFIFFCLNSFEIAHSPPRRSSVQPLETICVVYIQKEKEKYVNERMTRKMRQINEMNLSQQCLQMKSFIRHTHIFVESIEHKLLI